MVQLDSRPLDAENFAEGAGEAHIAAGIAAEYLTERGELIVVCGFVDIDHNAPRHARLVIVIAAGDADREAAQVERRRRAFLDLPGEDEIADTVGRAPVSDAVLFAARADCRAIAGFVIAALDAV